MVGSVVRVETGTWAGVVVTVETGTWAVTVEIGTWAGGDSGDWKLGRW